MGSELLPVTAPDASLPMPSAIRIHQTGGPEVLKFEEVEVGAPAPDEVQVRHTAIGVNYIDVYDRTGLYPMPLPGGARPRGCGRGHGARQEGAGYPRGRSRGLRELSRRCAYSEVRNVPADRVVKVPTRHFGSAGGGDHAQGHDCAVSAASDVSREAWAISCSRMRPPAAWGFCSGSGRRRSARR